MGAGRAIRETGAHVKDFLNHLEQLVIIDTPARVLWRAHRSCSWIIDFDDFCQRVLLRAIEHLDRFRGETIAKLLGWLRAIGRQLAAQLRRTAHACPGDALLRDIVDQVRPSAAEEAAYLAEQAANRRWLTGALAAMRVEDSRLLHRRYWDGESLVAIAEDLGLSRNAVTQRHGRILRRLRVLWRAGCNGE
jgi:RNA polymerase sigma factor (sigma-70 family)